MATTATSATTSTNIDVNSIVSQLMTVERQPINKLNTKEASYQAKLSAFGSVKGAVANFQTALQSLGSSSSSSFQAFKATPSDATIFSATATSAAVAGTYSLEVTSLAQAQKLVAAGQTSSTTAIGTGTATTVTFDFGAISGGTLTNGTYSGATFTSGGAGTKSIVINGTNNTLQGIRDTINAAKMGVTATIVNDGSGTPYRLALSSDSSGASSSIKITTNAGDAAIDSLLSHDPAGTQSLSETVTAQNANFKVNGIAVSKTSNTVSDAIQGVTLKLTSKTTTPASLTVERDAAAISTAVSGFAKAYNDLSAMLKNVTAYNTSTKQGAALQGDGTVRNLQAQLRGILNKEVSGGTTFTTLSQIGVSFQQDGTLKVDSAKLDSAIAGNFSDTANLFNSATGYATKLDQWATSTLALDGIIAGRTDGISKTIKGIGDRRVTLEAQMTAIEKRYRTQYSALDAMLSSMNQTSTYLTQQLSRL